MEDLWKAMMKVSFLKGVWMVIRLNPELIINYINNQKMKTKINQKSKLKLKFKQD